MFLDEAGLYLLPAVVKTWAPRGERPLLHTGNLYTHLSLISAVTPDGALYFHLQEEAFDSARVIDFLTALHTVIPGKLLVVWDNAPIHRSDEIKDFLAAGAAAWLHLESLPGYAPDLNPDEGVWHLLKYCELKNICFQTLRELMVAAKQALHRIKASKELIKGCFLQAGLC